MTANDELQSLRSRIAALESDPNADQSQLEWLRSKLERLTGPRTADGMDYGDVIVKKKPKRQ